MSLVAFALRRPISLVSAIVAIVLAGLLAMDRMPRDIFPDLGVPTIYVAQPYGGMDPVFWRAKGRPYSGSLCSPFSDLPIGTPETGSRFARERFEGFLHFDPALIRLGQV